jgi:hypothetical protein
MANMTCTHGRLLGSCEDCAHEAAQAAGLPLGGPHPAETRKAAQDVVTDAVQRPATRATARRRA